MTPIIGEIRLFAGKNAPEGWEFCDGRILTINDSYYDSENTAALYSVIGTTYGGDAGVNFALPNLSMRVVLHRESISHHSVGAKPGSNQLAIYDSNLPAHKHTVTKVVKPLNTWSFYGTPKLFAYSENGNKATPSGNLSAFSGTFDKEYYHNGSRVDMMAGAIEVTNNTPLKRTFTVRSNAAVSSIKVLDLPLPPYVHINYIICRVGQYPAVFQ